MPCSTYLLLAFLRCRASLDVSFQQMLWRLRMNLFYR
jgi:hypothetical protein